jgi:hypothetical protein
VGSAYLFPPDDTGAFARYAHDTVAHFAADGIAWEVWNEENEGWRFWPPHEDPAAYDRLLCAAYPAIKSADRNVPVLFGGVFFPAAGDLPGMSGPDFVAAAYRANPQLGRCYDAMAYHPYPYPFTAPDLDVPVRGSVYSAADQMRAVLTASGDGRKPLWITEVGWPTHNGYGVSEDKQAQYTARMMAETFAQGVPVLTWYTYGDFGDVPGDLDQEAHFGFFRVDNTPKPAYQALTTFASVMAGADFVSDLSRSLGLPPGAQDVGGRGFALEYHRPAATVTALWLANESVAEAQGAAPQGGTATPSRITVHLPVAASSLRVVDYLGVTRTVAADANGRVALDVGPGPIYVVDPDQVHGALSLVPPNRAGTAASGQQILGGTAGLLALPAASQRCRSKRAFLIRVLAPAGRRVLSLSVYVNGRRVGFVRRPRPGWWISLRGLSRQTLHVRLVARVLVGSGPTAQVRLVSGTRTYRACVRRRAHRPRPRRAHVRGSA